MIKKLFIVYQGILGKEIRENLEKKSIYLQPGLPSDKPLRTLRLESVGAVADGGTQVHSTKEIEKITIPKIEEREGNTVVYYTI